MATVTSEIHMWYTFQSNLHVECILQRRKIIVAENQGHIGHVILNL